MIKKILLIGFCLVLLVGCSSKNDQQAPENTLSTYPGPIEPGNSNESSAYPGPTSSTQAAQLSSTQVYFVDGLVVPTPISGKAVVTGVLMESGESTRPFITSIYLSAASPAETAGEPPIVNYSELTDPIAVQDIKTGKFVFSEVTPGQYAFVIWSQNGGTPLQDETGKTILVEVTSSEVKDLGNIHVP